MSVLTERDYVWLWMIIGMYVPIGVFLLIALGALAKIRHSVDSLESAIKHNSDLLGVETHVANIDDKIELHLSNIEDRLSEIADEIISAKHAHKIETHLDDLKTDLSSIACAMSETERLLRIQGRTLA